MLILLQNSLPGGRSNQANSFSQPNLLNRFTSGLPSILGSTKTNSIDETISKGTNSFFKCISCDTKCFEYSLERDEQTLTQLHS